ncbi:MAG: hypothetical protein H7Y00_00270 [Fimbriimonadaceae bacterium]|nr:hypothetical protein [Chitinophagales bacterium]
MKKLLPALFLSIITLPALCQTYGNEWISYDQKYIRFDISKDGIYRIDYSALNTALSLVGETISSIDPRNLQLFNKGEEQYIHIEGEDDGVFNASDFIEFFGKKNDGTFDSNLYNDAALQQVQTYFSIMNDTAVYFLTWNDITTNNRLDNLSNNLSSLPPVEQYCNYESLYVWGAPYGPLEFSPGRSIYSDLYSSRFDTGEGFTSGIYSISTVPITLNTPHIYSGSAFNPVLSTVVITVNTTGHDVKIDFNSENLIDTTVYSFSILKFNFEIDNLEESNTLTYSSFASSIDYQRYAYADIQYPREFNFDDASQTKFNLSGVTASERYLEITNFDEKSTQPVLYDLTDHKRIIAEVESDISKYHLDYAATGHAIFISSQDASDIITISDFTPVTFINYSEATNQGDFLIISHPVYFDDGTGTDWVETYRTYRNSLDGGGYNAKTIDINQLYDQFSYGIRKHPLAIRNFGLFAKDNFIIDPKYVLLIGKSFTYNLARPLNTSEYHEYEYNYVPTFGHPGSDNLLMCRPNSLAPEIAIGRLTVLDPDDIRIYYEKLVEFEAVQANTTQTVENKAWMKNILHFAGGLEEYEQDLFDDYLTVFGDIIEDTLYGANILQFNKTSTDPILYSTSDYLDSLVNAGVSLMTFFGHSATASLDYNIGDPEEFENEGRYHVVFSNGCNTAAIHGYEVTLTEKYVFAEQKAAIAFIAASTFSVAGGLYNYGKVFYDELADKCYLMGIGDIIKAANDSLDGTLDMAIQLSIEHTTLQGDPSIRINSHQKPDYAIEAPYVFFDPAFISTAVDSFTMNIVVTNLGMAIDTNYSVEIKRHMPDGTIETFLDQFPAAYFRDTLKIKFFTDAISGVGINAFDIHIDNTELIPEIDEMNNILSVNTYIISNDAIPIYPYEFAIVNHTPEYIAASTADVFASEKQFVMQIDTTMNFNSMFLRTTHVNESGGIIKWEAPPITWLDSIVYYWRISLDTLYDNELLWRNSSFIHKPGIETGWNQSHYFQYTYDTYHDIILQPTRKFEYITTNTTYILHTGFDTEWYETYSYKNGELLALASCASGGFVVIVSDYATAETWETYEVGTSNMGPFGDVYCSSAASKTYQQFNTNNSTERQSFYNFLNSIPDSNFILLYSWGDPEFYNWSDDEVSLGFNLLDVFEEFGATEILSAADIEEGRSYVFKTKKGAPSTTEELIGLPGELIEKTFNVSGFWNTGFVETSLVGPASYWDKIKWKLSTVDSFASDVNTISVIGVTASGLESTLVSGLTSTDTTINWINATDYPYVKLRLNTTDDLLRTPAQIDYLRVLYVPVPEAALNPNYQFNISADSVQNGDNVSLNIAVTNISELNMDSLLIDFNIVDQNNIIHAIPYQRQDSLLSEETMISSIQFNTVNYPAGLNTLFIEVNPDNDQPEQYHFNNLGFISLYVQPDNANPLLDVTFDGTHILEGDIVSADPNIIIQLKDENTFLALDDTSYLNVQMRYPNEELPRDLSYDGSILRFYPADTNSLAENNAARIELTPGKLTDGIYELIVHGEDASGNNAGNSIDYTISFEVINKPMISNVFNYPNPFTTQTRFVFTLTGSEVPEYFKIQIMTVTGKVIREIMRNELGELHVGNNITEFAWDGTDAFGDPVANGLYLYRVVTKLNGKSLEKYDTETDLYFNNGFGKMYLAR